MMTFVDLFLLLLSTYVSGFDMLSMTMSDGAALLT